MHIMIDDRENSPEIIEEFSKLNITISIARLDQGDYLIDNQLVFERKTLNDLAASIIDGRLFRQVNYLSLLNNREEKMRCALLIEGTTNSISNNNAYCRAGVDRRAIQGAILKISLFKGIPILRAMTPQESARIMVYAGNQNERGKIPKQATIINQGKFVQNKRRAQLTLLQSLPGVGPERANELLKKFGNVNKILQATEKELAATKYIGQSTAQKIKWVVNEAAPAYQV